MQDWAALSIEDLRAVSGYRDAKWLEPRPAACLLRVVDGEVHREPIPVRRALAIRGFVLVEAEPANWYMGSHKPDGTVDTWGNYGELEQAIRGL